MVEDKLRAGFNALVSSLTAQLQSMLPATVFEAHRMELVYHVLSEVVTVRESDADGVDLETVSKSRRVARAAILLLESCCLALLWRKQAQTRD